ncbi:hypothetical protein ANCCEY_11478 [Ancylostoma ceylanicum]|uniref:Protein kinase domain-containing protein n=1 Tax=Ancylostoma ceylanicum TaxID=53326 RepID=A0A0D6LBI9_9BILA|nr:hypothetical protein ANCCEY_11478 [Ancylostoma ceylanicum]
MALNRSEEDKLLNSTQASLSLGVLILAEELGKERCNQCEELILQVNNQAVLANSYEKMWKDALVKCFKDDKALESTKEELERAEKALDRKEKRHRIHKECHTEGQSAEPEDVEAALRGKTIDGWSIESSIGSGANGIVLQCQKDSVKAVMKIALSTYSAASLEWESLVMDKLIAKQNIENRTLHLVRKLGSGSTEVTIGEKTMNLAYVIMECLPGNPVPIIGSLQGEEQTLKIIEYGLQLLKAIYDMHQCGFIHRDIKPENIGMYDNKIVVMYDMGMARAYLDEKGRHRPPRSHAGMRGTEEWSSLNAEIGRDQGRVDDLWGWLYCLNEWVNCRSQKPQFYLRYLGRDDTPDYFYLASLLHEASRAVKRRQKPEPPNFEKNKAEIYLLEREFF